MPNTYAWNNLGHRFLVNRKKLLGQLQMFKISMPHTNLETIEVVREKLIKNIILEYARHTTSIISNIYYNYV